MYRPTPSIYHRSFPFAYITLICGPPGSGKTTYARAQWRDGDLLLDFDTLMAALGNTQPHQAPSSLVPFACGAQEAVLGNLAAQRHSIRSWVIGTLPRGIERAALKRRLNATAVIVLETSEEECIRRLLADKDRCSDVMRLRPVITDWWLKYERNSEDTVIVPAIYDAAESKV